MTFRAKPVVRRSGRPGWDAGDRRTTLINAGFVGAIALSILILVGYAAWSFYDDHWGTAATVDGTVITKDDLRARFEVESFRIDYTEGRIRTLLAAGRIDESTASQQLSFLGQRREALGAIAVERLIDATLQDKLAAEAGITVTEADIDAQLLDEATSPESRHAWMIEVEPEDDEETGEPGTEEKAAAKAKAEAALARIVGGAPWEDVAREVSTAASAPQAGDLGWLPEDSGYDEAFSTAIFDVAANTPTAVIEGEDGVFRIGRVTEIAVETVDQAYSVKIEDAGMTVAAYRVAVRSDVVRKLLSDKIVADLSKPGKQRQVLQIFLAATTVTDGIKVRHILWSPKDDPSTADDLPADDPAWAAAKAEADAAYAILRADPSKFDRMARTESDEGSAVSTGGKQPFYAANSAIDPAFWKAISADGLKPGDLIAPFKTQFGWHIAQFMREFGDGQAAWLVDLRKQIEDGADFGAIARDQGEGPEAEDAGDIGWIAPGQLGEIKEVKIFDVAVGGMTAVIEVPEEGYYLFKVVAEEVREPDAEQLAIFKSSGFSSWYSERKAEATITRDISASADVTS